ncbi:MAG: T9SS type A sorting domain-containing protein [Janthinobacterium lividum]
MPILTSTTIRYQLNGTALTGYRGGLVLSPNGGLVNLNLLGNVTIRTYLSTSTSPMPTKVQDEMLVDAKVLGARIAAGNGYPVQLELISTAPFNQVEIVFGPSVSLGAAINIHYAYGVGPNTATQIMGLTSNSSTTTPGQVSTSGDCAEKVANPSFAVDNDKTNYATFSSLASVFCTARLTVGLDGTAPSNYKAGFVIGQDNNLLDASVLSSLVIKTYRNGVLQETGSGSTLLGLSVLPDSKSLVTFQATKSFDAVSIERSDAVALLDDLRLYYGVGVASTTPPQTISSFANPAGHYQSFSNGVVCVNCGVTAPANAAGSPNSKATISTTAGVASSSGLQLDLNGTGNAGNRAGMVLGNNSLLDLAALDRVKILTYDAAGNVLETANGSSLINLSVLPDGRRTVSFNTTKDFAKVGIVINDVLGVGTTTDVYYAFSDSSNGSLAIVAPTGPLPVTLTSFTARRQSAGATISWATASESNSARFVVERSTDLVAGFSAIGEVAAAGTANTPRTYTLQDPAAATLSGTLYYRLRQVDLDGSAHLSTVVVLTARAATAAFALYPNPATASQQVTLDGAVAAGYSVSLYSSMGQLLSTRVVSSEATTTPLAVSTSGLAAGIYYVVLRDATGQLLTTQRLQVAGQ